MIQVGFFECSMTCIARAEAYSNLKLISGFHRIVNTKGLDWILRGMFSEAR